MSRPPFFAPSRPLPADGGLKARSKRGKIAQFWWSERFIAVLEDIGVSGRLQRGRAYARRGQVLSLSVEVGSVTAQVQGSRTTPYRVRIGLAAYGKAEWSAVERELAGSAWFVATLLAGEMPEDIEQVFAALGLSLFPATAGELSMDCSCPDFEVPCKHLAATLYLLAETFDEDPFAILEWRGRDRADLLANLHAVRAGRPPGVDPREDRRVRLDARPGSYFGLQGELPRRTPACTRSDALLAQLPAPDLAIRGRSVVELLSPLYVTLDQRPD